MDIQNRVVNYYNNNPFIQKYLKGINANTNEVLLNINGQEKSVTIDELESIKSEADLMKPATPVAPDISMPAAPVMPAAPQEMPQVASTPSVAPSAQQFESVKETLNDIKILTELKNKDGLDNLLKKFAVNPTTGLIDINTAISVVTRNTMNEVEKAIKNNYVFNSDSSLYDIEGRYEGENVTGFLSEDEQIANSFNNIKIYIDASKMYPDQVNYNDAQISTFMQTYIKKVKEELHGSSGVPAAQPKTEATPTATPPVQQTTDSSTQPVSSSAGFADIFVLCLIVIVYAIIIVNLVLKII